MALRQIKKEDYDFFENINRYIKDGKSIELTLHPVETHANCNPFSATWGKWSGNEVMAKKICNNFINIYKKLKDNIMDYANDSNYKKDFAFLKYWVNWKIHGGEFNKDVSATDFYDHIGSQFQFEFGNEFENSLIYDINEDELNKMNILYRLYMNYTVLDTILDSRTSTIKKTSLSLSTACCKDYFEARYICDTSNNSNSPFCNKLNDFKSKYDKLNDKFVQEPSEISDYLIKLSECPNTKIISTAVTGTVVGLIPLLGVLYKFTPMGQVIRTKIGIINKDISNNDEDMTNISLMEQEKEPSRFQQGRYNIKYQSL